MLITILALGSVTTAVLFWRRFQAPGLFLATLITSDIARALLAPLRAGYEKPYRGTGFALWLVDVAFFLITPCSLLWALKHRQGAALIFASFLAWIGLSYPALRGQALIHVYSALYMTLYVAGFCVLVGRAVWRERMLKEELCLLVLTLMGAASVLLVWMFGIREWWSVWIPNGAAYVTCCIIAGLTVQPEREA